MTDSIHISSDDNDYDDDDVQIGIPLASSEQKKTKNKKTSPWSTTYCTSHSFPPMQAVKRTHCYSNESRLADPL